MSDLSNSIPLEGQFVRIRGGVMKDQCGHWRSVIQLDDEGPRLLPPHFDVEEEAQNVAHAVCRRLEEALSAPGTVSMSNN